MAPQTARLAEQWPSGVPESAEIADAPFFPQRDYECGPAALATALVYFKAPVTPDDLVPFVYIPARKGTVQAEMLAAPRRFGMVSYELAPRFEDLIREVADGTPVVILQREGAPPLTYWHYATAIGFNARTGGITLRSGEERDAWRPLGLFEYSWKKSGYWAMVATPPDRIPVTADPARYLQAIVAVEKAGQTKTAAVAYSTYIERWPDEIGAYIGLGNAYYAMGDLPGTERALRRGLERHPDAVVVMNNLAHTLADLGRDEEALKMIDRAAASPGEHAAAIEQTRGEIVKRLEKR